MITFIISCEAAPTGILKGKVSFSSSSNFLYIFGNPTYGDPEYIANIILSQDGKIIMDGVSDGFGYYKVKNIEPGIYTVSFQCVHYVTEEYSVIIKANETTNLFLEMKFDLSVTEPIGSHGYLTGFASDSTGIKLPDVKVIIMRDGNEIASGQSQTTGEYTIANLPPGLCTIQISADGFKPQEIETFNIEGRQTTKLDITLIPK
jgi:hypothetical protein